MAALGVQGPWCVLSSCLSCFVYTYCLSSFDPRCIMQPLVVSIASNPHPLSTGQGEEAKR